jgi:hypothetical protein
LQVMQEIRGALRVCGGGEDRALVVLQDFQPAVDIGGMIGSSATSSSRA